MKKIAKIGNDLYTFQSQFQKDLNDYAYGRDVLFVVYCLVVPFFSENYLIVSVLYGVIALFYLNITIDFRKQYYIYCKSPQTYREIIEQHNEILRNNHIRQTTKYSNIYTNNK